MRGMHEQLLDWMPGDRDDVVAQLCRRFMHRLATCRCGDDPCAACQIDAGLIERAWHQSPVAVPTPAPTPASPPPTELSMKPGWMT